MYGYHLDGPLEPLTPTSSPQPHYASSPFPSPIRRMVLKRRRPGREPPPIQKHRVVQVHHWHLSEAQRQSTGYRGCSSKLCEHIIDFSKDASSAERLSALLDAGYRLVRYDDFDGATLILDRGGTCVAVIIPPKLTKSEMSHITSRLRAMQAIATRTAGGRRGSFKIVGHGVQMGGGSRLPTPRAQLKKEAKASRSFFADSVVKRHLRHVEAAFRRYFPKLHQRYQNALGLTCALVQDTEAPSLEVPFASFTLNVGDKCTCGCHLDGKNLAAGVCLASPFGDFDYKTGGHLILHDLKLVLEIPPGGVVLFPSALITHENIPIAESEYHQSITAFTPASLFQWVDHGFQGAPPTKHPMKKCSRGIAAPIKSSLNQDADPWRAQVRRFSHYTSILNMCY